MSTEPKSKDTVSKEKKPKLMRDSFTIPKTEYAQIEALKARAMTTGVAIKKSELLRAGLMALTAMGDAAFVEAIRAVPALKTGRPSAQPKAVATAAPAESPTKPAAPQAKPAVTAPTATPGKSSTAPRTRKPAAPKPAASPAKAAAPAKTPAAKKPATPARKTPAAAPATPVSAVAPAVPAKKAVRKS